MSAKAKPPLGPHLLCLPGAGTVRDHALLRGPRPSLGLWALCSPGVQFTSWLLLLDSFMRPSSSKIPRASHSSCTHPLVIPLPATSFRHHLYTSYFQISTSVLLSLLNCRRIPSGLCDISHLNVEYASKTWQVSSGCHPEPSLQQDNCHPSCQECWRLTPKPPLGVALTQGCTQHRPQRTPPGITHPRTGSCRHPKAQTLPPCVTDGKGLPSAELPVGPARPQLQQHPGSLPSPPGLASLSPLQVFVLGETLTWRFVYEVCFLGKQI